MLAWERDGQREGGGETEIERMMNAGLVSTAMMETDIAAGHDGNGGGYQGDRKNARDARFSGSRR